MTVPWSAQLFSSQLISTQLIFLSPKNMAMTCKNLLKMMRQKVSHLIQDRDNKRQCDQNFNRTMFELLDANFINDKKKAESVVKGVQEFNIPTIRGNRKLVASVNGGLQDPCPLVFNPAWGSKMTDESRKLFGYPRPKDIKRPANDEDVAFMTVVGLSEIVRTKQITSEELTGIFLKRLKRYNGAVEAVVSYTKELAYKQAKDADEMLSRGLYLGPLHGIPYGLKDIVSVPQYRTTWGSKTFKDQVLDMEAWVYKRLKSSGAVLIAKLACGSLAYDDIWFGGRTRNPWNIEEFTSGSSSGPAAATSAGLVPFAIGSETLGSLTLPASRCGVTALRPTFGMVGRSGVMSISESLDKLGPVCRSAVDCAIVLDAIRGIDPNDLSSRDIPLGDPFMTDIKNLTVGYLDDADMEVVRVLESKGVKMVPFKLKYTVDTAQGIASFTMDVDMLAHFDEWQRSGHDDDFEAQDQWPAELYRARMFPAVDYLQAQRARGKLVREIRESFRVDAMIGSATDWERVCVGNLVGIPVIVIPTGFNDVASTPSESRRKIAKSTGIYAPPYRDDIAVALAMAYQSETDHHRRRPPIDD